MKKKIEAVLNLRSGAFRERIAWVFGLQLIVVATISVMGIWDVAPLPAVIAVIVATTILAWLATREAWRQVGLLARLVSTFNEGPMDPESLRPERWRTRTDDDVALLAHGLRGFADRIASYNQRELNFTRDASHELRSPLTVIKMSVDMLGEEQGLSDFGRRSLRRMQRAAREMETLVEALLMLARESDSGLQTEHFVVNDVLLQVLADAREMIEGHPIELVLDEPARFALQGSRRVFSVLCWQLIRNACQQVEQGRVVITVSPGCVAVSNRAPEPAGDAGPATTLTPGADRHGFELAIAQRISDRFKWPLELQSNPGRQNVARIRFPNPLPAGAPHQDAATS